MSKTVRSIDTDYASKNIKSYAKYDSDGIYKFLSVAKIRKKVANTSIHEFFISHVNYWFEQFYTDPDDTWKSDGNWKKNFDSLSDVEQVRRFLIEDSRRKEIVHKKTLEYFDNKIKQAKAERLAALEELDEIYKSSTSSADKREATNAKILILKLKLAFRPLTTSSKKMILTLTNETERTAEFYLKCNTGTDTEKTLLISMPAKGIKQIGFAKDKFSFNLGERCEFYYNEEKVEDFKVEK